MAANFKPIFTLTPNVGLRNAVVSAANVNRDGTGVIVQVYLAGANGSLISQIVWQPTGTNVASVGRMWLNDGGGLLAANFSFLGELALPANIISEVTSLAPAVWYPAGGYLLIPANYKIYCAVGTVVAAGFAVTCPGGGDY